MTVKSDPPAHATMLLGMLLDESRSALMARDWSGLRVSHFRVLAAVPADGIGVTDLARVLGMTKQGCGQFVAHLADTGHLVSGPDPRDRRARLVTRTQVGDQTTREVAGVVAGLEHAWSHEVGEERYRVFREVLTELALRPRDGGAGAPAPADADERAH